MKRYDNFHVCLISPISYWHVTCLSRHSYMLMNEWKNPHHSQSKVVCRNFLGLWVLKHSKIYITAGRQWLLKFPRRGRNTESYLLSGFGNGIFRGSERKSTSGRFATSRVWMCTWINFGSWQGKVNNWEFCKLKVTPIVCFFDSTHFSSWALSPTHFTTFFRGLSILFFPFINNVDFSCPQMAIVFINKIIHGCL